MNYSKYTNYSYAEILSKLREHLDESRFNHSLNVQNVAIELAKKNNADESKAGLAGLIHDYAKQRSDNQFIDIIKNKKFDPELLQYNNGIWHGIVGTFFIEKELNIHDEQILNAVRRHTVGSPNMTKLDKIIFVADFIEPNRNFPGVDEARKLAYEDLDKAVWFEVYHTFLYLLKKQVKIYPGLLLTYNSLVSSN